ncbi:ANK2 [Branchiostoma lanceolatum]|uniref:ANK2 protein n=1 Tax=Branchiostoma lanceolatum TaxID=7740 RepID=A0A8J9VK80_BRALA|nr:ANK2 [Branchiostoma lanceolatum]
MAELTNVPAVEQTANEKHIKEEQTGDTAWQQNEQENELYQETYSEGQGTFHYFGATLPTGHPWSETYNSWEQITDTGRQQDEESDVPNDETCGVKAEMEESSCQLSTEELCSEHPGNESDCTERPGKKKESDSRETQTTDMGLQQETCDLNFPQPDYKSTSQVQESKGNMGSYVVKHTDEKLNMYTRWQQDGEENVQYQETYNKDKEDKETYYCFGATQPTGNNSNETYNSWKQTTDTGRQQDEGKDVLNDKVCGLRGKIKESSCELSTDEKLCEGHPGKEMDKMAEFTCGPPVKGLNAEQTSDETHIKKEKTGGTGWQQDGQENVLCQETYNEDKELDKETYDYFGTTLPTGHPWNKTCDSWEQTTDTGWQQDEENDVTDDEMCGVRAEMRKSSCELSTGELAVGHPGKESDNPGHTEKAIGCTEDSGKEPGSRGTRQQETCVVDLSQSDSNPTSQLQGSQDNLGRHLVKLTEMAGSIFSPPVKELHAEQTANETHVKKEETGDTRWQQDGQENVLCQETYSENQDTYDYFGATLPTGHPWSENSWEQITDTGRQQDEEKDVPNHETGDSSCELSTSELCAGHPGKEIDHHRHPVKESDNRETQTTDIGLQQETCDVHVPQPENISTSQNWNIPMENGVLDHVAKEMDCTEHPGKESDCTEQPGKESDSGETQTTDTGLQQETCYRQTVMDEFDFVRAAREGDIEKVRRGLEEGVNVNDEDSDGATALHQACRWGHDRVVELLIKNGADLNRGNTALKDACGFGQVKVVELLIKNGADLNVTDKAGITALHQACIGGHDEVVGLLIKNGADLNAGITALHNACIRGPGKVVELLLKNGADLNAGDTALHKACLQGHDKVVELLIKNGADLNDGATALHKACTWGHGKVVELLIKNGADLNVTDKAGITALHKACIRGPDKVVELLLKNGADLNAGDTALHKACLQGHDKVVELLIKNGADLNDGATALHKACTWGHGKVVELLIKNGADLNVTDKAGITALHKACIRGPGKVVELLLKNGADLNAGITALHKACMIGHDKIVEMLLKNGADVNAGDTALHNACIYKHNKVVELLIKNRADLLVTNKEHKRPTDVAERLNKDTELLLKTETRKQEEYSELVSSVGSERGTTVKLFLCGDGQVGKTSLRAILNKTGFIVGAFWNLKRRFRRQDVFNPTPGVHVSSKTVRGIGRLSLHDFAGQAQFYVTHAMLLRTTNVIFPVVYKITDGEDEQKWQARNVSVIHGWLSFIYCSNADPTKKPRIVLIASHADKIKDKQVGLRRATALVEYYTELFQESLVVSQEVFLINCMEARSSGIHRLREVLAAFREDMLKQRPQVPKVCVQLSETIEGWREERKAFPVMGWQDYLTAVRQATSYLHERILQLASSYLHDEGEIIYLRYEADSSVVLDPQWLFTSVFGSLLAPENFPIDKIKRTDQDYVTLEEITRVFSSVANIPLLIKLLQDFQLCHTYDDRTFILPSLLQQEMEEAAWSPVSSKAVYLGLQIRGRTEIDSFSCDLFPRLQTLMMQAHPGKLSRPLLWKNSAKCTDGKAEALLQITQDKRQLNIFVRSNDGNREDCNSIMDLLKNMTYRLLHETSPGARSRDMVLSALDLREHRPQPHAYSREEVEAAASKGENLVHPQRNVPEKVKDLLLHIDNFEGMPGREPQNRPDLAETLPHISSREKMEAALAAKSENFVHPQRNVPEVKGHLGNLKVSAEDLEDLIRRNYPLLGKRLQVSDLIPHLIQRGLLQLNEKEDINSKTTGQGKAEALLDLLSLQGKCTCEEFVKILRIGNHEHLVDRLTWRQ